MSIHRCRYSIIFYKIIINEKEWRSHGIDRSCAIIIIPFNF